MKRIHVVGRKNHGKTSLLVELIGEYCRRGVRVGSIKHSSHRHELDTPGKDSQRHGAAGSCPSAIVTPDQVGLYLSRQSDQDPYSHLGDGICRLRASSWSKETSRRRRPKVEVWRAGPGHAPLAGERTDIVAVISNDRPKFRCPSGLATQSQNSPIGCWTWQATPTNSGERERG